MTAPAVDPAESQTGLQRLLDQFVRLDIPIEFAILGLIQIVRAAPRTATPGLSDELKAAGRADGTLSGEDLLAAGQALTSGDFAYELATQFLLGLASHVGPDRLRSMLDASDEDLERLFEAGRLIAREGAGTFAAPSWLVDTSEEDGLTYASGKVLMEDAPYFATTFGGGIYLPRTELTAEAPLSPERWLGQSRDVRNVVDILLTFPAEPLGEERP